ncbi:MAG: FHA domain-containing protein [Acidobacteriota bacterium]
MPRFTILKNDTVERSLAVLGDDVLIGRQAGAEIVLPGDTVSRRHARIRKVGPCHVVEDLGSVNGIHVRGETVEHHELAPGDRIDIEFYTVVYEPSEELYRDGLIAGDEGDENPNFRMTKVSAAEFTREIPARELEQM